MRNFNAKECKSERNNYIVLLMNIMDEILDPLKFKRQVVIDLSRARVLSNTRDSVFHMHS